MKRLLVLLAILAVGGAKACYNDRDTLGYELRNKPDVQRALTGRFERNPPLYYSMRVARLRALPRLTAAEHDDLAVALDRLGRSDEALAALDPKALRTSDDRYRFFANRGTIRAHRWLRRGAKASERHELKVAEGDIARALRINPNAHFGREAVQLELIRWLQKPKLKSDEYGDSLGSWLQERVKGVDPMVGLSGLIQLGGAWESPDVAFAIAEIADVPATFSIEQLALQRYRELRKKGIPLLPGARADEEDLRGAEGLDAPAGEPTVGTSFQRLRAEAEAWNRDRAAFMLARLKAGRHPDTDPTFWRGWQDVPMPRLDPGHRPTPSEVGFRQIFVLLIGIAASLVGASVVATLYIRRWTRRRRTEKA